MSMRPGVLLLTSVLLLPFLESLAPGQVESAKTDPSKSDHSQEAFVVEQFSRKEKFENDGTAVRVDSARVRIQSEAGVQQYGVLTFSYASATGTFEIGYVRVHKPDGSVVETPPESVQDMSAQITREAPFYSDLHEKHVAVKGLSVGDVIEFQTKENTTKPLAPGQFWTSYEFTADQIVLDEQLEISVPRDRVIKVKSAKIQPAISEAAGYRVYTWHSKSLQHKDESNKKRQAFEDLWKLARGRRAQPDVQISSFTSWEDVGRWYGGLQEERVRPTPEVTAKATELTKNAANDDAKMRALYSYVSTQFHYIGIAFGVGRYQPHGAETVLENQYGDCKDKHTLLASLLAAAGIPAYPALISTKHEVDADVPSPGQFDHVITVVPRDGGLVWLDSTAEVGPYQFLVGPLRDKHALAVWKDKPAALVSTPTDLPYESKQTFDMDAKLSDAATLEATASYSARGDVEYYLRAGFRAVPVPQWKDLGQRISQGLGFGGDVSEVTASSPEKTDEPFHFAYKYTRKSFGDWPNHRIVAPEPMISLPAPSDDELLPLGPVWLGALTDVDFRSRLELPKGHTPILPTAIHLKRDFAEYDATYEFKDGKMIAERHLKTLLREVPASEREQYKQFAKVVEGDYGAFIDVTSGSDMASAANLSSPNNVPSLGSMSNLRNLPDSSNAEAGRLEKEGSDALAKKDFQTAVSALYRAVSADPKFTRAWVMLGTLLLSQKQKDAGIDAFHKAIALDPEEAAIPKAMGFGLMSNQQYDDAIAVWQDFIKARPDDVDGPSNLGNCLLQQQKYPEAASAFEAAVKIRADRPYLLMSLGSAYLKAGDRDKAGDAYMKAAEVDSDGNYLNDVAYFMADANLKVPMALDYARKAVKKAEEDSEKITLPDLKIEDVRNIFRLAAYWDTLGWAAEKASDFPTAEQYLRAAWKLTQDGVVAGHLCDLYRKTHQTAAGINMCRIAIYRIPLSRQLPLSQYQAEKDAVQENLNHLTKGATQAKGTPDPTDIVIHERTFKLPRFLPGTTSAEFFVLLASDGKSKTFKVEDVTFVSGSEKMKLQGKQLKTVDFNFPAPDSVPSRFVRRGILGCYEYTGCSFVLLDAASVNSVY
jgi:tetratricopeptide (TPR) repeat protein/transglutaminase-like putative cysteine protease